jgi:hypothetical protein
MALSRPALEILGISLSFVRAHPQAVVVAVAEAIYRAAASKYHPDKGTEVIPLPSGVNLTELQEARDAVRSNPNACIKEIGWNERTSREGKLAEELAARVTTLEDVDDGWSRSAATLWDFIAREKLGLKISEEKMEKKAVTYSTLNLNGVAVLVAANEYSKSVFHEYLRHNGTWFKRPLVKVKFTKKAPCPPCVPSELINESSAVGTEQGNFYDQSGPHTVLERFEVLGSYVKADIARARVEKRKEDKQKPAKDASIAILGEPLFKTDAISLDPLVVRVLRPSISVGSILQAVVRDADGSVRYLESGVIVCIRVFDHDQRP